MFLARWQIDARFGHKQAVIDLMNCWLKEIGSKAGSDKMDVKLLTGSVGGRGHDRGHTVESLADLELLRKDWQERVPQAMGHRPRTPCGVELGGVDYLSSTVRDQGATEGAHCRLRAMGMLMNSCLPRLARRGRATPRPPAEGACDILCLSTIIDCLETRGTEQRERHRIHPECQY
jgi:hypothetical protein